MFSTVKDIVSIFYSAKNQVRGLCEGGDTVILFFSGPAVLQKPGLSRSPTYQHNPGMAYFKWLPIFF